MGKKAFFYEVAPERWRLVVNTDGETVVEAKMSFLRRHIFAAHQLKLKKGTVEVKVE